jgi:hypothetical protein
MPKALQASLANNVDDSAPIDAVTVNAFSTISKLFPKAGYDASKLQKMAKDSEQSNSQADSTGLEYAWSGIIGVVSSLGRTGRDLCLIGAYQQTTDSVPFIGEIPGKSGQYIGAGFNGHGKSITSQTILTSAHSRGLTLDYTSSGMVSPQIPGVHLHLYTDISMRLGSNLLVRACPRSNRSGRRFPGHKYPPRFCHHRRTPPESEESHPRSVHGI